MTWLLLVALGVTFIGGCFAGSAFTWWALMDMVMKIDDARAEGRDCDG